ncbi:hypothetical protein K0M31_016817 [Melipona bicolor]|uniref:Uncharacterized protein n=1 Tax=Melipona bicolor TaxID=60889 RepID=A0AA40FDY9_9HYME|nr:hypothetical protein K0M31_016817 [Melipona bicolor]
MQYKQISRHLATIPSSPNPRVLFSTAVSTLSSRPFKHRKLYTSLLVRLETKRKERQRKKRDERFPLQDEACIRERDGPEGVCDSKACEEASKRMVAFMKKGVDPCKDFYQFACGGIRDQQPYQPSSSFNMLQARVDDHLHSE